MGDLRLIGIFQRGRISYLNPSVPNLLPKSQIYAFLSDHFCSVSGL